MAENTEQLNICHLVWFTIEKQSQSCRIRVRCLLLVLRVCLMELISLCCGCAIELHCGMCSVCVVKTISVFNHSV